MHFRFQDFLPRAIGSAALLAALVGFCRESSAEYFQYGTTINIGAVSPVPNSVVGNGSGLVTITTASNTPIVFTGLSTLPPENLVAINGGTDIVFGVIDAQVVNATPLQNIVIPFSFDVTITDYPTDTVTIPEGVGVFTVSGVMSGQIGPGRRVAFDSIVLNPVAPILIGNDLYAMTLNSIVRPGPVFPGAIGGHVEIIPEPGSIALLGLGLVGLATPVVRRRIKASRQTRI